MENEIALYVIAILGILVFAALLFISFRYGNSWKSSYGNNSTMSLNTISISATGTAYNTSSEAQLYVTVNATGSTSSNAVQNLTQTLNSFNSTILPYVNGNRSEITTEYFNIYKLYNQTGYQAEEDLSVTLPSIANTSSALGALSSIPSVYVTSASPQLSNAQISVLRTKALSVALQNATSQAYALIGSNNTIYATNISVNTYNRVYPFPVALSGGAAGSSKSLNSISSPQFYGGTSGITESVTVEFEYGPKTSK